MIRPFMLADILMLYSLQRSDTPLAIEHTLTHPRPPLWLALTAPWPWAGAGVATYVLKEDHTGANNRGFVQLLKRSARPEADLLHMAPALPAAPDCDASPLPVWRRLLAHCAQEAALYGIERLFVSIPDGGPEQPCLAESNFRLYARETIYRLPSVSDAPNVQPAGFRRQLPQDSWALQRLYLRSTPHLVQQAEGAMTGRVGSPPLSWWEPERWRGVVWAPTGEVRGAAQAHLGRAGNWLRFWGASGLTARELRELVEQGLRLVATHGRPMPVYATVRDYEIGLAGALTGFGFAPYTDRARFVRHTVSTAMRRVTVPAEVSAREVRTRA